MKAHMLAFQRNAWTTIDGFTAMLRHVKSLGFAELVVIPSMFGPDLDKQVVTTAAEKEAVKLTTCGFRAKAPISPYTTQGIEPAITALREQFSWQTHFANQGVGDLLVCGPVLDDWGAGVSTYSPKGLLDFARELKLLGEEMKLTICAEVVNRDESSIVNPHVSIPALIRKEDSPNLLLHADVVHVSMLTSMDAVPLFFKENREIVGAIEFGMPGRLAMPEVPEFVSIAKLLFNWVKENHPTISPSVEEFDEGDVIKAFDLEKTYSNRRPGVEVLEEDVLFLREHEWI